MRALRSALLVLLIIILPLCACKKSGDAMPKATADLSLSPTPPVVGTSDVTLTLRDEQDKPLTGADVRIEGNMNHAGMKPSFADLEERDTTPGEYVGSLEFTMGGDWFILISAKMPDGKVLKRKIDVAGVKAP